MKKFRLKIFSLVLCFVMCLALFSGCSLFIKKDTVNRDAVALTIGETKITNGELIDAYRSFYQQNYYYFMYYDEDTIMDVFYDNVIAREIILAKANELLDSGEIVIGKKKAQEIWNDVYDYIYGQVDTKEKALLLQENNDEEKLPKRLQSESSDDEEEVLKYEPYEFKAVEKPDYSEGGEAQELTIEEAVAAFKANLYSYNAAKDKDDEDARDMQPIAEEEVATRTRAYEEYLADLIRNAKTKAEKTDPEELLAQTIKDLYNSYYENALYTMYQEYINATIIDDEYGENGGYLNDAAIANKFRQLMNTSEENNSFEDSYVSTMTSTSNSDVVLFHYEGGRRTFFTVQHILIPFSDEVSEQLKTYDGYETSKLLMFRQFYEKVRATFVDLDEMMATVRDLEKGTLLKDDKDPEKNKEVSLRDIVLAYENDTKDLVASDAETLARLRIKIFNEYAWRYSSDTGSLKNGLDGAFGFTISSRDGEHGSYVKDFTNGARQLYNDYLTYNGQGQYAIGGRILPVVSDYGVHLMMLTGIYDGGTVVDINGLSDSEIVAKLKTTYVSTLTEETLYDYIYDTMRDELIGSSGTFFSDYRNKLVKENEDNVKYKKKLTYEQLNNAINN